MDRSLIARVFADYRDTIDNLHGVETRLTITETDFLLTQLGWTRDHKRVYTTLAHFIVRDDKLWIEQNDTDLLVELLVEAGLARFQIVLAFLPEAYRQYSAFAIA